MSTDPIDALEISDGAKTLLRVIRDEVAVAARNEGRAACLALLDAELANMREWARIDRAGYGHTAEVLDNLRERMTTA